LACIPNPPHRLNPAIVIDLPPLYTPYLPLLLPRSIATSVVDFLVGVREGYVERYRDRFFMSPPAWFRGFLWLEVGVHGGVGGWCVAGGLVGGEFGVSFWEEGKRGGGGEVVRWMGFGV